MRCSGDLDPFHLRLSFFLTTQSFAYNHITATLGIGRLVSRVGQEGRGNGGFNYGWKASSHSYAHLNLFYKFSSYH